ncbi:hypothetical protein ATANTOWER_019497 [Ataeniobius toweri]|uniref:Uncharacterized protein n=1 Tax=Ataeniobius toweri TaxID=208326 RepID=A0ABU7A871_9TELE|nr:hypothetical protein [Ataeniobius toweri]
MDTVLRRGCFQNGQCGQLPKAAFRHRRHGHPSAGVPITHMDDKKRSKPSGFQFRKNRKEEEEKQGKDKALNPKLNGDRSMLIRVSAGSG